MPIRKRRHDVVVYFQGDLPTIDPASVRAAVDRAGGERRRHRHARRRDRARRPSATTPTWSRRWSPGTPACRLGWALYFTRATAPSGEGPLWHHIGLYVYRRTALERFVALPPGPLERRERLEQLRALEAGMRIDVARVDTVPLGVDTPADLERARALLMQGMALR